MLNNMKSVTPGSIAYAALMFRHCINSLDDWRTEDDLFSRDQFFESMVSLLSDQDDAWVKDTMSWWNMNIFGTLNNESDDQDDQEPSTLALILAKRKERSRTQVNQTRNVVGERGDAHPHDVQERMNENSSHSPRGRSTYRSLPRSRSRSPREHHYRSRTPSHLSRSPREWHHQSGSPRERHSRPGDVGNATVLGSPRYRQRNQKDAARYRFSHSPLPTRNHERSRSPAHVRTSMSSPAPNQRYASGSHQRHLPLSSPVNHGRRSL